MKLSILNSGARNVKTACLVDKPDQTQVTFKTVGRPAQLELEQIDSGSDRIDYKYLYGVNVTFLEFMKQ